MIIRWWVPAVGLGALGAAAGVADTGPREHAFDVPDVLIVNITHGTTIEAYLSNFLMALRRADRNDDGLDRDDVDTLKAQTHAKARSATIEEVLRYDLDHDFKVSRQEIVEASGANAVFGARQAEMLLDRFDSDRDGVITLIEASDNVELRDGETSDEALLALDPSGDDRLTIPELQTILQAAFDQIDSDRSGKISAAEHQSVSKTIAEAQAVRRAPYCDMPPLPAGAELVAFGSYESDAVSSVVIGGPDKVTNITDVVIEPGTRPLYVVLTSYETMIWRFTGATSRVAHVAVSSHHTPGPVSTVKHHGRLQPGTPPPGMRDNRPSGTGVIGIAREKVTIGTNRCPGYFYEMAPGKAALLPVRRALGRYPDAFFASYSAEILSLPSGKVTRGVSRPIRPPRGFDQATWPDVLRYWPGGLVRIDPRAVVAKLPVEPYKVLPSQMGLSQLIGAGAVKQVAPNTFRVVKPIAHMPPGMTGGHAVKLIIAKGVSLPPGDPGHSCVLIEGKPGPGSPEIPACNSPT